MKTILIDAAYTFTIKTGEEFIVFEEMKGLLDSFPNRKIVLSGADDQEFIEYGLDKVSYEVFTLKHNPEKTDPEYYKIMLKNFGLDVNGVVYFEHNSEAVKSAQSIGITTYCYDDDKKDLEGLKRFLDDNL